MLLKAGSWKVGKGFFQDSCFYETEWGREQCAFSGLQIRPRTGNLDS